MDLLCQLNGSVSALASRDGLTAVPTFLNGTFFLRGTPLSKSAATNNRVQSLASSTTLPPLEPDDATYSCAILDSTDELPLVALGMESGALHVVRTPQSATDNRTTKSVQSFACLSNPIHTVASMPCHADRNTALVASKRHVALVNLEAPSIAAELTLDCSQGGSNTSSAAAFVSPFHVAVAWGSEVVSLFDIRSSHSQPVANRVVAPQSRVCALATDQCGTVVAGTVEGRVAVLRATDTSQAVEQVLSIGSTRRGPIQSLSIGPHANVIAAVDMLESAVVLLRNSVNGSDKGIGRSRRHIAVEEILPQRKDNESSPQAVVRHAHVEVEVNGVVLRSTLCSNNAEQSWYSEKYVSFS